MSKTKTPEPAPALSVTGEPDKTVTESPPHGGTPADGSDPTGTTYRDDGTIGADPDRDRGGVTVSPDPYSDRGRVTIGTDRAGVGTSESRDAFVDALALSMTTSNDGPGESAEAAAGRLAAAVAAHAEGCREQLDRDNDDDARDRDRDDDGRRDRIDSRDDRGRRQFDSPEPSRPDNREGFARGY